MKILGIGVDIIKNSRIKKSIKNTYFIKRVFGKEEVKFSNRKTKTTLSYYTRLGK